jgi:hypothetical protein
VEAWESDGIDCDEFVAQCIDDQFGGDAEDPESFSCLNGKSELQTLFAACGADATLGKFESCMAGLDREYDKHNAHYTCENKEKGSFDERELLARLPEGCAAVFCALEPLPVSDAEVDTDGGL